jgi:hypothetical protein
VNDELATRHAAAITEHLGVPGRMVGLSKSGYTDANRRNLVVFNANICFRGGKVWWGDVDLTIDEPSLTALAAHTQETVYVLHESDGRFRHEADPLLQRAVYSVTPDGHTRFDPRYVERAADRRLYSRPAASATEVPMAGPPAPVAILDPRARPRQVDKLGRH